MDGFWWTPGMSGKEIYENFQHGPGTDRLSKAASMMGSIVENYETRLDTMSQLKGKMESAWQGDASGAAQRGAGPLVVEHAHAAPQINTAQTLVQSQVQAFDGSKGAVVPVPDEPKEPGFWDNVFSFGGAQDSYEQKRAAYDAANDNNVTVMSGYEDASSTNTSSMPQSYGSIEPDHAGIGIEQPKPPPPPGKPLKPPPGPNDPGDTGTV